jgi:hypothetical protein
MSAALKGRVFKRDEIFLEKIPFLPTFRPYGTGRHYDAAAGPAPKGRHNLAQGKTLCGINSTG